MNHRWWQLWIIFEKHKGINLFLPCGCKSSSMFEPNNNTKHCMLRIYVYLSNKAFIFFNMYLSTSGVHAIRFTNTTWTIMKYFHCYWTASIMQSFSKLWKDRLKSSCMCKVVVNKWACVVHTCITLPLLAFVSRSLITQFLISGEMHASLTRCVPASAPVTDRFIDNILHSIIYPDHSWYAGDMWFHEPIIRVWMHWVIDERWKLHQLVSYTLSSLLSEHRRSF